jgi:hypothetical protein
MEKRIAASWYPAGVERANRERCSARRSRRHDFGAGKMLRRAEHHGKTRTVSAAALQKIVMAGSTGRSSSMAGHSGRLAGDEAGFC